MLLRVLHRAGHSKPLEVETFCPSASDVETSCTCWVGSGGTDGTAKDDRRRLRFEPEMVRLTEFEAL